MQEVLYKRKLCVYLLAVLFKFCFLIEAEGYNPKLVVVVFDIFPWEDVGIR